MLRGLKIRFARVVPALVLGGAVACDVGGSSATAPETWPSTASLTDPVGDTFGSAGPQWDVTALTVTRTTDGIIVFVDFANDIVPPVPGDPSGLIGEVELDLDQNVATGHGAVTDEVRTDHGSTGLGVDATIVFGPFIGDSSVVTNVDLTEVGRAETSYSGHRVTIKVPRALLRDDNGWLNAAVVVGHSLSATDFAPQSGHLTVGG